MGLPDETVPKGSPDRFRIRLVQNTKPIRIVDSNSQPIAGAKVSVMLIQAYLYRFDNRKYQESVARQFGISVPDLQNYSMSTTLFDAPPADLKREFEGGTDANGNVIVSGIEPDKIRQLVVETESQGRQYFTVTRYSFGQHPDDLTFRLRPVGRIEGQLSLDARAQATGFRLEGLKLSFKTTVPEVAVKRETEVNRRLPPLPAPATTSEGRGEAVVDANGRFIVPMIASGLVELADPIPKESSLYVDLRRNVELDPGKTLTLTVPVHRGIHVRGRVRLRNSEEPVVSRSIALTSFPGTNFGIQQTRFVVTDAAGRFEGDVRPGLLEYWLNGSVDGYTTVYAFEHSHPRASSGMHFRVPDGVESIDLPPIELVPQKLRQGKLLDLKGKPAEPNWDVYGYPAESQFQSAHGETADEGRFTLSFAEPYPPATFVAKIDPWHARPGSDRRRYRLKIVSDDPFVVQMATADPPQTQHVNSTAVLPEKVTRDMDQVRQTRIKGHDRESARKLQGQWKLTLPRGFVYQAKINQQPDGQLRLSGAVIFSGIYTLSKGRLELVESTGSDVTDFVWQVQDDGTLKLTYEEHSVGATYRGAVLAPVPVTSAIPVTPVPAAAAKDGDSVSHTGATLRGRVTLKGPIPNVPAITLQPTLRLLNPRSTKEELTNAESIARAPKVEIPDDSLIVSQTRGIANVALFLRQIPQGWTPMASPTDPVKLKVDSFRFQPRVSFIRVGQSLQILNSLQESTNIRVAPVRSNPFNRLVARGSVLDIPNAFSHSERLPVRINSDVHPWMTSWLLVQDHPFVAISNVDGQFEIRNLPAGEHHFVVWHERCGYLDKDLVVRAEAGKQLELGLEYDSGRFQPDPPKAAAPVTPPASQK